MLMKITTLLYNLDLNIISFETFSENNLVFDIFRLEIETDDYYFAERLEHKIRFEIPEIKNIEIIEK